MTAKAALLSARVLLDLRCPPLVELAAALGRLGEVRAVSASPKALGIFSGRVRRVVVQDPPLEVVEFPVQRGYFSFPLWQLLSEHRRIAAWVRSGVRDPGTTWLVCCYPHYSKVAALWPGPVAYYPTDLFAKFEGHSYRNIAGAEKDLCRRASLVCPNSQRVADYLMGACACDGHKILVLPNAVRRSSLLPVPAVAPSDLPEDSRVLPRPVAGVIGNMGANVDWVLLEQVRAAAPWLSWLFVGPTGARIHDPAQNQARARLLTAGGRVQFIGSRPHSELGAYARSLDVAVLPYMKREPTYSGSSTRFYEHLAACRPILATDGFEELLHKRPLLKILTSPADWVDALNGLRQQGFRDGLEELRWQQSHHETWESRAERLCERMLARGVGAAPMPPRAAG